MDPSIRKPLAKVTAEKYRPRTIKFKDAQWREFAEQALAEGIAEVSTYVRACAIDGLESRRRERLFAGARGMPGSTARAVGIPTGRTAG